MVINKASRPVRDTFLFITKAPLPLRIHHHPAKELLPRIDTFIRVFDGSLLYIMKFSSGNDDDK